MKLTKVWPRLSVLLSSSRFRPARSRPDLQPLLKAPRPAPEKEEATEPGEAEGNPVKMAPTQRDDNDTTTIPNPIYREVKAWIAQKEAYELKHNQRADLTGAQRQALEALRLPSSLLPTVGHTNWVGLLNEFRQVTSPGGQIEYLEEESGTILTGGTKGRICRVELGDTLLRGTAGGRIFPCVGADNDNDNDDDQGKASDDKSLLPVFATKKMAKQYAAKCAVEWLIAAGRMPANIEAKVERRVAKDDDDNDDDANAEVVVAAGATTSVGSAGSVGIPPHESGEEDGVVPRYKREMEEGHTYMDVQGSKITDRQNGRTTIHPPSPRPPPSKKRSVAPVPPDHTAVEYPIEPISASTSSSTSASTTTTITTHTTTVAANPTHGLPTAVPTNARELVAILCQDLGFPNPRYVITPPVADDEPSHGPSAHGRPLFLFDGHPEFAHGEYNDELIRLREYARLTRVRAESQETMKNVVAGKLLARLREVEAERRVQFEALMKGLIR